MSTAMPSGPLAPKKVRNAPTLVIEPSEATAAHTWFARVTAMKRNFPLVSRAMPFGLGIREEEVQLPLVRSRYTRPLGRAARSVPGR